MRVGGLVLEGELQGGGEGAVVGDEPVSAGVEPFRADGRLVEVDAVEAQEVRVEVVVVVEDPGVFG